MGHQKDKIPTNIYLPEDIHRRLQLAKVDTRMSISSIVEHVLREHLDGFLRGRKDAASRSES